MKDALRWFFFDGWIGFDWHSRWTIFGEPIGVSMYFVPVVLTLIVLLAAWLILGRLSR